MPRATNDATDLKYADLKSLAGGFVKLRRMTYGQFMKRQGMAMDMQMRQDGNRKTSVLDIDLGQEAVTQYEFSVCVAEHNLEDDAGNLLDFKNPAHVAILDPRVGQEIGQLIDELNKFEEETAGN